MEDATDFSKAGAFSAALCKYLVKQSPREYQRPSPLFRNLRCRRLVIYKLSMSDNVFDFETLPSLEGLVKHLGGLDECKRLGREHMCLYANCCSSVEPWSASVDESLDTACITLSKYPAPTSRWCFVAV